MVRVTLFTSGDETGPRGMLSAIMRLRRARADAFQRKGRGPTIRPLQSVRAATAGPAMTPIITFRERRRAPVDQVTRPKRPEPLASLSNPSAWTRNGCGFPQLLILLTARRVRN